MNRTGIEYLDYTWSPIAMRCTKISPGCENCWHLKSAHRLSKNPKIPKIQQDAYAGRTGPVLCPDRLNDPTKIKKPAVIGTQLMGDLFHENVDVRMIDQIIRVIYNNPQHTFLILTKRVDRMAAYFDVYCDVLQPMKNLWIGISAENQEQLNKRLPVLLQIPAAVHFVSVEPMLSEIYFKKGLIKGLDWCIIGCESGPKAREMKESWVRRVVYQCNAYDVPVFYKQKMVDGKILSSPKLDGKRYQEFPQSG